MIPSGSLYFLKISCSHVSLQLNNIPFHFVYVPHFYYLSVGRRQSWFRFLAIINRAAINMYANISLVGHGVLWVDTRSETADS